MEFLESQIDHLPHTSAITLRRLKSLEIKTFWDLINYFPFRYEDYSLISPIDKLQPGETVTVKGRVAQFKNQYLKRGLTIQKAILDDGNEKMEAIWYNQPYLIRLIKPKTILSVAGKVEAYRGKPLLQVEEYEILKTIDEETIHTGRIVPVYPERKGLSSKTIRGKIFYGCKNLTAGEKLEFLPEEVIGKNALIGELIAYQNIHFPKSLTLTKDARQRLAFDEIFIIQLSSQLIKQQWQKEKVGHPFNISRHQENVHQLINSLPFLLTRAQRRCLGQIMTDLARVTPMNRLLQGDVGSGKTVVAASAAYLAHLNGFKTLFMAPTEILAQQHYQTLTKLFNHRDYSEITIQSTPEVTLLTGSSKPKKDALSKNDIIIGTHALITKKVNFSHVGLVVVDEQHKFGVQQRAMLKGKGTNPHLLTMTATPIPRTVVLTLYGELDLSFLDEMPEKRMTVKTYLVSKQKRKDAYQWIKKQIRELSTQVFIICPLIEESEMETLKSVKAAKIEFEYLTKTVFADFRLGLLHGKMKAKEKEAVMRQLIKKEIDILVSTPVVEVGIDIPNATIIVIEAAERFGLAQLHQLRGRVGRGEKQSYCLLFATNNEEENKRLKIFTKLYNGFELAELDLKIRGAGDIYGTRQHGIPNLKVASLTDFSLIEKARKATAYFLNHYHLTDFLQLQKRVENYRISLISRD